MTTQNEKLQAAYEVLCVLCECTSDSMPIRQALAFVATARRAATDGEADLRDIAKDINAEGAVASRDLIGLGIRSRNGSEGHDLVTVKRDMKDLRRKPYVLTTKGQALVEKLVGVLDRGDRKVG